MIKKQVGSKGSSSSSKRARSRSPSSSSSSSNSNSSSNSSSLPYCETIPSDSDYLESDYDSRSILSDNSILTYTRTSRAQSNTNTSSVALTPQKATSLPITPVSTPQVRKTRSTGKEMKDIDGYLRQAENTYEKNHRRARCPKCRVTGQITRDSSAGSRRYKCRTPECNRTMGCREFHQRYNTKHQNTEKRSSEEEKEPEPEPEPGLELELEHVDIQLSTGECEPAIMHRQIKHREMTDREDIQVKDERVALQRHKIAKLQAVPGQIKASAAMSNQEGCSSRSSSADHQMSICSSAASASSPHTPRQWLDPYGLFRRRVIGPAHQANMGISVLREGADDYRHDAMRVESRNNTFSLEKRVQMLGILPHMAKAALKTLESLRPKAGRGSCRHASCLCRYAVSGRQRDSCQAQKSWFRHRSHLHDLQGLGCSRVFG